MSTYYGSDIIYKVILYDVEAPSLSLKVILSVYVPTLTSDFDKSGIVSDYYVLSTKLAVVSVIMSYESPFGSLDCGNE